MTFHVFYSKFYSKGFYLDYDSEVTWEEIVDSVLHDPVRPKIECPAIVLNRFKAVNGRHGPQVRNRYEDLDHTTGFFAVDVDGTGNKTNLVKRVLFDTLPELRLVWTSSSGEGLKGIGYTDKLRNLAPDRFRTTYRTMCVEMRVRSGIRVNFDQAMNRCHQPVFINSDPGALHR